MTITHKLTMDLQRKGELQRIDVVQGDAFTREVTLELQCDGEDWLFPVCEPVVRYCKPDGTEGIYDTLPDGTPAFRYAMNLLTVVLAPQMLTCPGVVQVQVELNAQESKLATFTFLVVVEPGVALAGGSEDYVNWTKAFLPQIRQAEPGKFLRIATVDTEGRAVALEAAEDPAEQLTARMDQMEDLLLAVADRAEDAKLEAVEAFRTANEALPKPESAAVGQYLQVAEVNAQGVVTALTATDIAAGGSGNVSFMSTNFTVPEDVSAIDIDLPCDTANLILFNCVFVVPALESNPGTQNLFLTVGQTHFDMDNIPGAGSINITAIRFGGCFRVNLSNRNDSAYQNTLPILGSGGSYGTSGWIRSGNQIRVWSKNDDYLFPAGTQVKFWGVYFQ